MEVLIFAALLAPLAVFGRSFFTGPARVTETRRPGKLATGEPCTIVRIQVRP